MQDHTLTFSFPNPHQYTPPHYDPLLFCSGSELISSSSNSTPFVSAPSSPSRMKGFYFSAPTSPNWARRTLYHQQQQQQQQPYDYDHDHDYEHNYEHDDHQVMEDKKIQKKNKKNKHKKKNHPPTLEEGHTIIGHKNHKVLGEEGVDQEEEEEAEEEEEDDDDACYSRRSFYANAIPFSWEEKAGTPKARRSRREELTNPSRLPNDEDSSSIFLSGSSEFEFSSRFSEVELEAPMSPTPISTSFKPWPPCDSTISYGYSTSHANNNNHNSFESYSLLMLKSVKVLNASINM